MVTKEHDTNLLVCDVLHHLIEKYHSHLTLFLLVVLSQIVMIPGLNISKSFFLRQWLFYFYCKINSCFFSLQKITSLSRSFLSTVLCMDSKSELQTFMIRSKEWRLFQKLSTSFIVSLLMEHTLISAIVNGTQIDFYQIPSHSVCVCVDVCVCVCTMPLEQQRKTQLMLMQFL